MSLAGQKHCEMLWKWSIWSILRSPWSYFGLPFNSLTLVLYSVSHMSILSVLLLLYYFRVHISFSYLEVNSTEILGMTCPSERDCSLLHHHYLKFLELGTWVRLPPHITSVLMPTPGYKRDATYHNCKRRKRYTLDKGDGDLSGIDTSPLGKFVWKSKRKCSTRLQEYSEWISTLFGDFSLLKNDMDFGLTQIEWLVSRGLKTVSVHLAVNLWCKE